MSTARPPEAAGPLRSRSGEEKPALRTSLGEA